MLRVHGGNGCLLVKECAVSLLSLGILHFIEIIFGSCWGFGCRLDGLRECNVDGVMVVVACCRAVLVVDVWAARCCAPVWSSGNVVTPVVCHCLFVFLGERVRGFVFK